MRALIVEDDVDIANQIRRSLADHGFAVDVCHDGNDAWFMGDTETYDVVILDLGLPGKDGLSVLHGWRQGGNTVPVLILTARDTWREKVTGLRAGADDYLTKPFEMEEMLARVEALTRRAAGHANPVITCDTLALDPAAKRITCEGRAIDFSTLEYRLVAFLIHHQDKVVSKATLSDHLYEQYDDRDSNVIEVLVNRCRKKLGPTTIKTLRGQGYMLNGKSA